MAEHTMPSGISHLIRANMLTPETGQVLRACLDATMTVIVVGMPPALRFTVAHLLLLGRAETIHVQTVGADEEARLLMAGRYRVFDWGADDIISALDHYQDVIFERAPIDKAIQHLTKTLFLTVEKVEQVPRITYISEVRFDDGYTTLVDLFEYQQAEPGKGRLHPTGMRPRFLDRFQRKGVRFDLPPSAFSAAFVAPEPEEDADAFGGLPPATTAATAPDLKPIGMSNAEWLSLQNQQSMEQALNWINDEDDDISEEWGLRENEAQQIPDWLGDVADLNLQEVPGWLLETLDADNTTSLKPPPLAFRPISNPKEDDGTSGIGKFRPFSREVGEPNSKKTGELHQTLFTAYYPRTSPAGTVCSLRVYAHLADAIAQIEQEIAHELTQPPPRPARSTTSAMLADGVHITARVEANGIKFDSIAITNVWEAPFVHFDFRYIAAQEMIGEISTGQITIQVGGIEIASITFATMVVAADEMPPEATTPTNPLAVASLQASETAPIYGKIFISYAREDRTVVEWYRLAQMALGHDVFVDTYAIRSGEDWRAALAEAIDEADIFQLFWSSYSAISENVRDEWDYALRYRCPQDLCVQFIRPVYWDEPMPPIPTELAHLNFRFIPFNDDPA